MSNDYDLRESKVVCLNFGCRYNLKNISTEPTCNFKIVSLDTFGHCRLYIPKEKI
jgi:hypothetical protein